MPERPGTPPSGPAGPAAGDVWRYPYLWHRQARAGETEGRKDRPCALAVAQRAEDGRTVVYLVPITSVSPSPSQTHAVEVPLLEKRRAGLDAHLPLWVIVDEFNEDVPAQSFYFEPGNRMGSFSSAFTQAVRGAMIRALQARALARVPRR